MKKLSILTLCLLALSCTCNRNSGEPDLTVAIPDTTARRILTEELSAGVPWDLPVHLGMASLMEVRTGRLIASVVLTPEGEAADSLGLPSKPMLYPASLAQAATLMHFMKKDPKILDRPVPTRHGEIKGLPLRDEGIADYERTSGRDAITPREGFLMSSSYVVSRLALDQAGSKRQEEFNDFVADLQSYWGLSKENGFPSAGDDDKQSLLMTASGKLGCLSQHQILRFYNAIAAGGTLSAEGPEKRLCSQAVADTLRALLAQNITSGTNRLMAGQGVSVAGKTSTAYIKPGMQIPGTLTPAEEGKLLHSTFAGFFPTENPEYTLVITVVYDSSTTAYVIPGNIATNVIKRI